MPQQAPRTVLTIDACGQALRVLTLSTINNDQPCLLREEIVKTACEAKAGSTLERGGNFLLSPASAPGEVHDSIFDWTVSVTRNDF